MDKPVKEKFQEINGHPFNNEEAENPQGEALHEELPQTKRGRKKRLNKNSMKPVNFKWPWELATRLDHYVADRELKEHRNVDRSGVVAQVLDDFLTNEGYPPVSKNS